MRGKLIVIEGSDGSGKQTQSELLYRTLRDAGEKVRLISFPNYSSPSSSLVKMYLDGEFGSLEESNLYASSTFFAVDRYASFKKDWEQFYKEGGIVIADRYTTSNMLHQSAKLPNNEAVTAYIQWLMDLEYDRFKLPKPDLVFFLDVPPHISQSLMKERKNKITGEDKKDIHEGNPEFMQKSYDTAKSLIDFLQWETVKCYEDNNILTREAIKDKIYQKFLEKKEGEGWR